MRHPRRNEVFRDVGGALRDKDEADYVEVIEQPLERDAAILLCSDGLTDMVPSTTIERLVRQHAGDPEAWWTRWSRRPTRPAGATTSRSSTPKAPTSRAAVAADAHGRQHGSPPGAPAGAMRPSLRPDANVAAAGAADRRAILRCDRAQPHDVVRAWRRRRRARARCCWCGATPDAGARRRARSPSAPTASEAFLTLAAGAAAPPGRATCSGSSPARYAERIDPRRRRQPGRTSAGQRDVRAAAGSGDDWVAIDHGRRRSWRAHLRDPHRIHPRAADRRRDPHRGSGPARSISSSWPARCAPAIELVPGAVRDAARRALLRRRQPRSSLGDARPALGWRQHRSCVRARARPPPVTVGEGGAGHVCSSNVFVGLRRRRRRRASRGATGNKFSPPTS